MNRSYRKTRPHSSYVYFVDGVMELYDVVRNAVSNWVQAGFFPSDAGQPYVFRGAELIRFHKSRHSPRSLHGLGVFLCLGCQKGVVPDIADLGVTGGVRHRNPAKALSRLRLHRL